MSKSHHKDICLATGKRRLRDHLEATRALRTSSNARSRAKRDGIDCRRRELRAYECESCRGWHLTSRPSPGSKNDTAPRLDPDVFRAFLLGTRAAAWVPAA